MTVNGANQATVIAAINALDTKTNGMATDQNLTDLQNNVTTLATTVGSTNLATTAQTVTGAVNELNTALGGKADTADLADVATSGSYTDLEDTPDLSVYATTQQLNTKLTQTVGNAPGSGEYVLGYVNGTQSYIKIVDASGN